MITEILGFGKYIFFITSYAIEHRRMLVSVYSLYDLTKFSFYVSDRIGIIDVLSKMVKKKFNTVVQNPVLIELKGYENSEVGEFEIIDVE